MRSVIFLLVWIRRLPAVFIAYFAALMAAYVVAFGIFFDIDRIQKLTAYLWTMVLPIWVLAATPAFELGAFGVVVVGLLIIGILGAYNGAVLAYRLTPRKPQVPVTSPVEGTAAEPAKQSLPPLGISNRLKTCKKIGIILAGGGAKGAYQAGAMKAIHEFLEQNEALDKVKMIAGTSIGSWNSMFWLADLVKSPKGTSSVHEQWWRSLSIKNLVEFDYYWPLQMNHFLKSTPWQDGFSQIFIENMHVHKHLAGLLPDGNGASDPAIHFYFTRSNVELGHLEFSTNWAGLRTLTRNVVGPYNQPQQKLVVGPDRYELIDSSADSRSALLKMRRAVFASMDLPPLFPYIDVKVDRREWFEDGGVVDNLPVWFGTQIEQCDLLFILPLNASFAEPVNRKSVTKRLFRVMDVRQGVLERNSLKLAYLYNELAAAKKAMGGTGSGAVYASTGDGVTMPPKLEDRVKARSHEPVSVFAICPDQPLVIGTAELWKSREAGEAFELMYSATKYELMQNFDQLTDPNWIRLVLVRPQGDKVYVDNF